MYPASGTVTIMPWGFNEPDRKRLEEIVTSLLSRRARFVFLSLGERPAGFTWLQGRLSGEGYEISALGNFAGLTPCKCQPRGSPGPW
jgi:hypothetical protein